MDFRFSSQTSLKPLKGKPYSQWAHHMTLVIMQVLSDFMDAYDVLLEAEQDPCSQDELHDMLKL